MVAWLILENEAVFRAFLASVVHTRLSVWQAHLRWLGSLTWSASNSRLSSEAETNSTSSSSSFSSPSWEASAVSSTLLATSTLNVLNALQKLLALSVTVAVICWVCRPTEELISSRRSAILSYVWLPLKRLQARTTDFLSNDSSIWKAIYIHRGILNLEFIVV